MDQDKVFAWIAWQGEHMCPHGHRPAEWIEEGMLKSPPPMVAVGIMCHACAALEDERKKAEDQGGTKGIYFELVPDDSPLAQRESDPDEDLYDGEWDESEPNDRGSAQG